MMQSEVPMPGTVAVPLAAFRPSSLATMVISPPEISTLAPSIPSLHLAMFRVPPEIVLISSAWTPSSPVEISNVPSRMVTFPLEWMASSAQFRSKMPLSMVRAVSGLQALGAGIVGREALLPPPVVTFKVEPERVRFVSRLNAVLPGVQGRGWSR